MSRSQYLRRLQRHPGLPDRQHGHARRARDRLGDRADQDAVEPGIAVRAHDEQIGGAGRRAFARAAHGRALDHAHGDAFGGNPSIAARSQSSVRRSNPSSGWRQKHGHGARFDPGRDERGGRTHQLQRRAPRRAKAFAASRAAREAEEGSSRDDDAFRGNLSGVPFRLLFSFRNITSCAGCSIVATRILRQQRLGQNESVDHGGAMFHDRLDAAGRLARELALPGPQGRGGPRSRAEACRSGACWRASST